MKRMMLLCLLIAGCDSPRPEMLASPARQVSVDEMVFRVWLSPARDSVEVHRINQVYPPPSRLRVFALALQAITDATGCAVKDKSLKGDHAIVLAEVTCPPLAR